MSWLNCSSWGWFGAKFGQQNALISWLELSLNVLSIPWFDVPKIKRFSQNQLNVLFKPCKKWYKIEINKRELHTLLHHNSSQLNQYMRKRFVYDDATASNKQLRIIINNYDVCWRRRHATVRWPNQVDTSIHSSVRPSVIRGATTRSVLFIHPASVCWSMAKRA